MPYVFTTTGILFPNYFAFIFMFLFVTAIVRLLSYFTNRLPTMFEVFIIILSRNHVCTSRIHMQTISPQKSASPRVELHITVPYLTSTTHLFQSPVYLNSLAVQHFTQILPWQNTHDHYFPQSLRLRLLYHLFVLLHHLLGLIHT